MGGFWLSNKLPWLGGQEATEESRLFCFELWLATSELELQLRQFGLVNLQCNELHVDWNQMEIKTAIVSHTGDKCGSPRGRKSFNSLRLLASRI